MANGGTIVFDLDGTLIDSAPDIQAVANATLAAVGAKPISLSQTHDFIGNGVANFVAKMMAACGMEHDPDLHAKLLAMFEDHYKSATKYSKLYPGVLAALDDLANSGCRMGLCTNKPIAATNVVLEHFGLGEYFDAVAGGDSFPTRKPDPAPLLQVFSQLSASMGTRLYVGDSEVDAETAERADIPFALFTLGYRKTPVAELTHAYAFSEFSGLPQIVSDQCRP